MSVKKLLCAMCLLFVAAVVVPTIYADPAIVVKNFGACSLAGSDANGDRIFGGLGVATLVQNSSNVMIKCKGDGITNLSGSGQSYNGFGCYFFDTKFNLLFTTDTHAAV